MRWKTEGKRRGQQSMTSLGSFTNSTGHEFEQTPWGSEGQGSRICCSPQGRKELRTGLRDWRREKSVSQPTKIISHLILIHLRESESRSVLSHSLRPHGLYSPWNSPGQNTVVGSLSILQGFFPSQGSNPGLPQCRRILYQLSHKGSPRTPEWVAYSFARAPSPQRNGTRGLLHCRQILYQLSYQGSPLSHLFTFKMVNLSLTPGYFEVYVASVLCDSSRPHGLYTVHGILRTRILKWVTFSFSRGIFPTQGLNPRLRHCSWILHQLNHKGRHKGYFEWCL